MWYTGQNRGQEQILLTGFGGRQYGQYENDCSLLIFKSGAPFDPDFIL